MEDSYIRYRHIFRVREKGLDKTDLEILKILQKDARTTISEISEKLEISRPTVRKKIRRLIELGIIKRFTVEVDENAIEGVHVIYRFKPQDLNSLLEYIKKKDEFVEIFITSGDKNIVAKAVYPNLDRFRYAMNEFLDLNISFEADIILKKVKGRGDFIPILHFSLDCDFCGKQIPDEPLKYTLYNRDFYFCCNTCLNNFKKMRE